MITDEKDKQTIFRLIDKILTNKNSKTSFRKMWPLYNANAPIDGTLLFKYWVTCLALTKAIQIPHYRPLQSHNY